MSGRLVEREPAAERSARAWWTQRRSVLAHFVGEDVLAQPAVGIGAASADAGRGPSSDAQQVDVVFVDLRVAGGEREAFASGLRDQHAIEGIAVDEW